jgi:hypothetical protein
VRWRLAALVGAGMVLQVGCMLVWAMSYRLTAGYGPEFTEQFLERFPVLRTVLEWMLSLRAPVRVLVNPPNEVGSWVTSLEMGLLVMSAGYLVALVILQRSDVPVRAAAPIVWGFTLVFHLTMVVLPGLYSTDIFSYVMYGRIAAVHAENPYLGVPNDFPNDPFLSWVFPFWRDRPSVYGPVWTDLSFSLSSLTGSLSNLDQVLAYKLMLSLVALCTLVLVWRLLGWTRPEEGSPHARVAAFAVFAWSPLVVFEFAGNAHNDVAMVALLLLGLTFVAGNRGVTRMHWLGSMLLVLLGALIKYTIGLVVVLLGMTWAARLPGGRPRLTNVVTALLLLASVAAALWLPWLTSAASLRPLADAAGGRLVLNSTPDLVALTVADLAPTGMEREAAHTLARFWMRTICWTIFGIYFAWELRRLWRTSKLDHRSAVLATIRAATRVLLVAPLLVLTWVWSWYFSWSLSLAALLGARDRLTRVVVAYTLVAPPVVYAHQYLSDDMPGILVVVFSVLPLAFALSRGGPREAA